MVRISSKLLIALLAVLLLALPLMAACDDDEDTAEPTAPATEPTAPATEPTVPVTEPAAPVTEPTAPATAPVEKTTVKVGWTGGLTGTGNAAYISSVTIFEAWFDYVNENNMIPGVELELITCDTEYPNPEKDVECYLNLKGEGVALLLDASGSFSDINMHNLPEDQIPVVMNGGPSFDQTQSEWVFMCMQPFPWMIEGWLEMVREDWDSKGMEGDPKVASVGWAIPSYGMDHLGVMERTAPDYGCEFVGGWNPPYGTQDFSLEGEQVVNAGADYVIMFLHPGVSATFVQAAEAADPEQLTYFHLWGNWDEIVMFYDMMQVPGGATGHIATCNTMFWTDDVPAVNLLTELMDARFPEGKTASAADGGWMEESRAGFALIASLGAMTVTEAIKAYAEAGNDLENIDGIAMRDTLANLDVDTGGLLMANDGIMSFKGERTGVREFHFYQYDGQEWNVFKRPVIGGTSWE